MYHPKHQYHWYKDTTVLERIKVYGCAFLFAFSFCMMIFAWFACWI